MVEPIVPTANADGAKLFLSAFTAGAQINQNRRQLELRAQEMGQRERLATVEHQWNREKLENQFKQELFLINKKAELERPLRDAQIEASEALAELRGEQTEHMRKGMATRAQKLQVYNEQMASLRDKAEKRAGELKLVDPKFEAENPVQFAANVIRFNDEFQYAPKESGIPSRLSALQKKIDQHKIMLPAEAEPIRDPINNSITGWEGKEKKPTPIWKVIEGLNNEATKEDTKRLLVAGGYLTPEKKEEVVVSKGFMGFGRKTETKTTPEEITHGGINQWLKSRVKIERTAPVTEMFEAPKSTAGISELFEPTQTDVKTEKAKAAIEKARSMQRPDIEEAIKSDLESQGIDTNDW
jgi:hypothetical protein